MTTDSKSTIVWSQCDIRIAPMLTQTLLTLKRQCWHKNTVLESSTVYQSRRNREDRGKSPHQTLAEREANSVKSKDLLFLHPLPRRFSDLPTALLYNLQHADCCLNLHYSVTGQTELENKKGLL